MQAGGRDVPSGGEIGRNEDRTPRPPGRLPKEIVLGTGDGYTPEQTARLQEIHKRLVEARRELDALIGDAYLRPRASIVPVHFLDLASAVEKLRWAEKEWRELDRQVMEAGDQETDTVAEDDSDTADDEPHALVEVS